jgi:hypothetical protein
MWRIETNILAIFLILTCTSCHRQKKPFIQRRDCCLEMNFDILNHQICPFTSKDFRFPEIIEFFNQGVIIDSGFNQNSAGDSIKFYKFYDDKSRVIFSLNNYSKGSTKFEIAIFEIKSNILKNNPAIHYKTTRNDFFALINAPQTDCDTIFITNKKSDFRYYRFEFDNDTLKYLGWEYILL